MKYKEDWETAKGRWTKWWKGRGSEGMIFQVYAPRKEPMPKITIPAVKRLEEKWTNIDYRIAQGINYLNSCKFLQDAFPGIDTHLGPGSFATHIGCEPVFAEDTVWYSPCIKDWKDLARIKLDQNNKWWKFALDIARKATEASKGEFMVSLPDFIENLDTIASLRGSEQLLLDLKDLPKQVLQCQKKILDLWFKSYDGLYKAVDGKNRGSCSVFFQTWAPGKMCKLQCDMSAMISRDMFDEFALPYFIKQCEWLDHSFYHLDGEEAIQHLDSLLAIDRLDGIQWTPGAGHPGLESEKWFPLYHKIQSAGKKLWLLGFPGSHIKDILKELSSDGLFISTNCPSEEEGLEILKLIR